MFRIVGDPSSGSIELYLTEICSGSQMFFVCLVGVWQRNFEPVVCTYGPIYPFIYHRDMNRDKFILLIGRLNRPKIISVVPKPPHEYRHSNLSSQLLIPSTNFPTHYLLIFLLFDAT